MKKFLKITAISLGLLLILALILPFLFKERIMTELKKAMNKNINGNIEFKDASLSIFKNFPKLTLSVEDFKCKTYVYQDTSLLFQASEIQLGFNIWTIINNKENLIISKVVLIKPIINLIEYDSLSMNSNIMNETTKDSTKSNSAISLDIQSFELLDGSIQFNSMFTGMSLGLNKINHQGSYYYSEDLIKVMTNTEIQEINYQKNKLSLLKSVILHSNLDFDYNKKGNLINLNRCEISLNNLKIEGNGSIGTNGDSSLFNLKLKAPNNQFKDLISVLPNAFIKEFNQVKSDGTFQLEAELNGVYSEKQKIYPSWKFLCNVDNGFLRFPDKSLDLENFKMDMTSSNTGPSLVNSNLNIKTLSFDLNKKAFAGSLFLSNFQNDLSVKGSLKGIINLSDINNFYPLSSNVNISGLVKPDISFQFVKSAIDYKQYDQIDFSGNLLLTNVNYHSKGQPDIAIDNADFKINPKLLELNDLSLKFGQSDINIKGKIEEPLDFLSKDQNVNGHLSATGKLLNLKEWMKEDSIKTKLQKREVLTAVPGFITKLNISVDCDITQIEYGDYDIRNSKATGAFQGNTVSIDQLYATINQNPISGKGKLVGVYSFVMNDQILSGDLKLNAKQFDADHFLAKPVSNNSNGKQPAVANRPFIVPKNFNLAVGFAVDELIYKPLKLNKVLGKLIIVNDEIQFEGLNANLAGGNIALKGLYKTVIPNKPYFNLKFDLSKLQFSDALASFVSLKKIAPIMQYIQGSFNTNLILEGILGADMFPILDEMNIDGLFETLAGSIQGFKPLDVLADKLKISELKKLNIGNTKNWVTIKNGIVGIKDFNKKIEDIDVNINGNHKISGPMDYQFIIKIPKSKVSKFTSAIKLDHALDQLNNLLSKAGLGSSVLTNLNLLVNLTGTATQPSFSFKLLNDKGEVTNAQDQMKDAIKTKITDSINNAFEAEKAKAMAEIKKTEDSLSKAASKKIGEVKNQVLDKAMKEAKKSVDSTLVNKAKETIDSFSQKILNKDAQKETDQIKDKLKDWNPFKKDKK